MKKIVHIVLFVLTVLLTSQKTFGQIDTVFWFAAPWVSVSHANNVPVALRFSTFNSPTTIRIYQPAGLYDTTFIAPANSLTSVFLSHIINTLESKPANSALNYGLKIEADTLITAVYEVVTNVNNPETYSLKGKNGLGTEFVAPFQTSWANGAYAAPVPKSMFCIVATEDNTTVWITPRANIIGHPANVTFSIVLMKGQTYTCENVTQATNVPGNNLSGSIIVANKPIAVTVSDDSVTNSGGGCRDLMGDQIVPVDVVGTEYIVNKGNMFPASNEGIYVVATQNFTTVTITNTSGTTTQLLNQGDTWSFVITAANSLAYVQSDKPVYVLQASGFGCELGEAILPPVSCAGSNQVSFNRTNNQTFILNILCPTSAINDFVLNGSTTLVPGTAFNIVPGTGGLWSGAQITYTTTEIVTGTSNLLVNPTDFFALGVINGGAGTGCYYHYMSSFIRRVFTNAGNDTTLCTGNPFVNLNGEITGATTTGIWTVENGTGTFNDASELITTYTPTASDYAQGELIFVLTSTGNCNPVTDTLKVTFIQAPIVTAGTDQIFCENNYGTITIAGGVQFATTAIWSGGNGGAFGNNTNLSTTYLPSPAELIDDSVALFLTSAGSFFACPSDVDTLIIFFTPKPLVDAGNDFSLCSSNTIAVLNGSISEGATTGIWTSTGTGAFSPSQTDLVTEYLVSDADTSSGSFYLLLTSTLNQDCLAEKDSILVTIIAQPSLSITSSDTICSNNTNLLLSGTISNGFGALWSTSGFGAIANPNSANTSYTISSVDTTQGFIDVFLATTGVCDNLRDSLRITFINAPIVNAGADQSFCENSPIQLNGQVTGFLQSGFWTSLGSGTFNPGNGFLQTLYFPSAGDISNGSVSLILETSNNIGCFAPNDTVVITFLSVPNADFSSIPVCQLENMFFTDLSTFSGGTITDWLWDFGDFTTSIVNTPIHPYSASGNYYTTLIVTGSNGCTDTITKQAVVNPIPNIAFVNTNACENGNINFTDISSIPSGSIVAWNYDFFGYGTSNQQNPSFSYPTAGTYPVTLTASSQLGCTATATQNVVVLPSPQANFDINPNPALVLQDVIFTDQTIGNSLTSWLWEFGDLEIDNNQNTTHAYENGGVYTITLSVTDANNCKDTVKKVISVALLPVLPTGFTPNGDGDNDIFIIRGGPFIDVDFKVYNNWGELIFSTNDGLIGWDGTYKGENAPIGVYTWTFVVKMGNGQLVKKSGDVTLMR